MVWLPPANRSRERPEFPHEFTRVELKFSLVLRTSVTDYHWAPVLQFYSFTYNLESCSTSWEHTYPYSYQCLLWSISPKPPKILVGVIARMSRADIPLRSHAGNWNHNLSPNQYRHWKKPATRRPDGSRPAALCLDVSVWSFSLFELHCLAPIPYLGIILYGIELMGCFPRGYFVLLGSRVRFELLRQVTSPLSENVLIIVVLIWVRTWH